MKLLTKSRLNHFRNQFVSELLKKKYIYSCNWSKLSTFRARIDFHFLSHPLYGRKFSFMQRTEREDLQTEYVSSLYMSG